MLLVDAIISFAPLIGYYSQYSLIRDTKSVGSFSIDICGIVLFANILRISFWFSSGYAINLLIQSFIVIIMQILLLKLCIQVGYKKQNSKEGFWRWTEFKTFMLFLTLFSFIVGIITSAFMIKGVSSYGNFIGLLSLSIEATIGFPQLISNQSMKSVEGLSVFMIVTWFLGDIFKTVYYFYQNQPYQFILSGSIQVTVDILILFQILIFRGNYKYQQVRPVETPADQVRPQEVQNDGGI